MQKFVGLAFLCTFISLWASGQYPGFYVAARTGLNMREKPESNAKVLTKIPYGTAITPGTPAEDSKRADVEGFSGYWKKITYNNQSGYIIDAFLLPIPPPTAGIKTIKDYFRQISIPFGDSLVVDQGSLENADEGGSRMVKQFFKNGGEWHEFTGYEYNSMTYFLPRLTLQQAFILFRLLPEFNSYITEKDPFINSNRKFIRNGREYEYRVDKELFGDTPWIERIRIDYEEGALYHFEMFQLDNQIVISYGAGV